MNRRRNWTVLSVMVVTVLLEGCSGTHVEPPKPKPAAFDPENAESTFRWLIREAKPVCEAGKLSHEEQMNNPLRKDQYNKYRQEFRRWNETLRKLQGKEVIWLTRVGWINEQAVQVDCVPKDLQDCDIKISARFAEYPTFRLDHCDGKMLIGRSMTLEEAKRLDRGEYLWVQGVIERVDSSSMDGQYSDSATIYVNQTRALLPQKQ